MTTVIRRMVLSAAALSPGVVAVSVQEMAVTLALMLLGITGAMSVLAVAVALSPKIDDRFTAYHPTDTAYPSLLVDTAVEFVKQYSPDPLAIRGHLSELVGAPIDVNAADHPDSAIALVLNRIMARWGETDVYRLSDDQARELWLIERLMRASPAEAGTLANYFAAPNAVLAMRDRIAETRSA